MATTILNMLAIASASTGANAALPSLPGSQAIEIATPAVAQASTILAYQATSAPSGPPVDLQTAAVKRSGPPAQPVQVQPNPSGTGIAGTAPDTKTGRSAAAKYQYIDSFLEPGQTSTFPGSADNLLGDTGGFRSWLADNDIGFRAILSAIMSDNPFDTGQPRNPQRYNGQRPTLQLAAQNFNITWTLAKLGLPNTRLMFGINNTVTSFDLNGKNNVYIRGLAAFQSFDNGRFTIKAGIFPNYYEYVGFYVGGSPILAAGISGLLPIQAGLGADPSNVPVINFTAYGKHGAYIRTGIQRGVSPAGFNDEIDRRGTLGIRFSVPYARPLYIGEIGIRRPATAGSRQIWLRVGGFYNSSQYRRYDAPGRASNASIYALADRQLTQPDMGNPARGVYVGASAYWIPKNVNAGNTSYEARIFSIGALRSRPKDTLSFRITYTKFSSDARKANEALGLYANKQQFNFTTSYSIHAHRGIYLVPGVSYLDHPSFVGDFKHAIIGSLAIVTLL